MTALVRLAAVSACYSHPDALSPQKFLRRHGGRTVISVIEIDTPIATVTLTKLMATKLRNAEWDLEAM